MPASPSPSAQGLKLQAKDAEDIQVISAILQDSIVPLCDMTYRPEERCFVMVAQRLRKETTIENPDAACERICSAIDIQGVESVQSHNLDITQNEGQMLELLMMQLEGNILTLLFSGDSRIRAQLGPWSLRLQDFGEPWPISCPPCHDRPPTSQNS
ncbi:MAG: DUF2948 family protein [Bdellovibrionales bacterium]